jgi:Domain of unknown function (DUF5122) beta-propeller
VIRRSLLLVSAVALVASLGMQPALALSTTPDPSWMANGRLFVQAQAGNTMYIGGNFTQVRSTPKGVAGPKIKVTDLGAIDVTTGVGVKTFHPAISLTGGNSYLRALAASPDGSRLYIGGRFDMVDGVPAYNLAAIDLSTGLADPTFVPYVGTTKGTVNTILVSPDGSKVYIGGAFGAVNGTTLKNLALLHPDGSVDATWNPRAKGNVRTLTFATDGATVFAGGAFTAIDGVARVTVARINATTGALDPWTIPANTISTPQTAWSLVATSTRLFGGFGRKPNFAQAFRLDNGNSGNSVWKVSTVGNVQKVLLSDDGSKLFAGGHFGTGGLQQKVCGSVYLHGLMLLDAATGAIDCTWVPQLTPFGDNYNGVWDIDLTKDHVWFAGYFDTVGGVAQGNVARVLK